jgi:uncharacterized protein Usg
MLHAVVLRLWIYYITDSCHIQTAAVSDKVDLLAEVGWVILLWQFWGHLLHAALHCTAVRLHATLLACRLWSLCAGCRPQEDDV